MLVSYLSLLTPITNIGASLRSRDNNFLRIGFQMSLSLVHRGENPVDSTTYSAPQADHRGISAGFIAAYTFVFAVYDDGIIGIGNFAVKTALDAVVFGAYIPCSPG